MPCEQCENGKYKWGKTGSCKYDTKAECEEDNKDYYEDMKETKIVELVIADNEELAIDAISLVTAPAIEQDFVFFGKEKNNLTFAKVDEEKRMLISPALIPGKTIFRHDPQTSSDYFVFFSKATVRKASELYLKHNNHHKATYQHQDRISGILTVESWIIEDSKLDKSTLYGFSLPVGTWMVKLKIDNDEIWSKIKDGELRGLSIEGYFTNKFEQMQKAEPTTEEIRTALKELLSKKKSIKVDLSLIDDIDYASEFLNKTFGYSNESIEKAIQLNKELDSLKSSAKAVIKEVDADYSDIKKWSEKGKAWFEQEIEYQIYSDGTFLQFSMNYHRVVVQLLTWGIQLSKLNNDSFKSIVYDRAEKSLNFLKSCMDLKSGQLPNYGSNDGALFFKLNDDDYRDYRSQLDDLTAVLNGYTEFDTKSSFWYVVNPVNNSPKDSSVLNEFKESGYYILQEKNSKTFVRCGSYKDRPYQSDNLHLDIWIDGKNILRDSGSYKYNTKKELINYFNGSEGHNTISIDGKDQMQKGDRFIWNYWIKYAEGTLNEFENKFVFNGKIKGFKHLGPGISHQRIITKSKGLSEWLIEDIISGVEDKISVQYWHFSKEVIKNLSISSVDINNKKLEPLIEEKWYSSYYGIKEKSIRLSFKTKTNKFTTKIIYKK